MVMDPQKTVDSASNYGGVNVRTQPGHAQSIVPALQGKGRNKVQGTSVFEIAPHKPTSGAGHSPPALGVDFCKCFSHTSLLFLPTFLPSQPCSPPSFLLRPSIFPSSFLPSLLPSFLPSSVPPAYPPSSFLPFDLHAEADLIAHITSVVNLWMAGGPL